MIIVYLRHSRRNAILRSVLRVSHSFDSSNSRLCALCLQASVCTSMLWQITRARWNLTARRSRAEPGTGSVILDPIARTNATRMIWTRSARTGREARHPSRWPPLPWPRWRPLSWPITTERTPGTAPTKHAWTRKTKASSLSSGH